MAGISRFEKGVLLRTAVCALFTGGWFWAGRSAPEPYTITVEAIQAEPSAPAPASEDAAEDGGRPDSLLEDEVIDLNTADAYDLDRLPGIGPAKAEAILTYREEHGPFQSVDELLSVSGIGEVTLENLRPYVTASGAAETAETTGG